MSPIAVRTIVLQSVVAMPTGVAQAAPAKLDVPLFVAERDGEARNAQPVTSGVPLPEGAFKDVASLRLVNNDGKEIPCQCTPTVQWFRDKSIRWVLLDFQTSMPAFAMRPLFLRDDGPGTPIDNPIVVNDEKDRIVVTTGPLRFAVKKSGFNLVDEAWLDEAAVEGKAAFDDAHRIVAPGAAKTAGPVLWSNSPNLAAAETIVEKTRGFRKSSSGAWIDGIALEGHQAWYELTGDKKAIETVIGGVDAALTKNDLAGAILQSVGFAYGQTGDKKYLDALVKGFNINARGRRPSSIDFGNNFHSTGQALWYLTETLPKKEEVPVLKWKQ